MRTTPIAVISSLFVLMLLVSCNSNQIAEPESGTKETEITQLVDENQPVPTGQIHNEVLAAINAKHDLLSGEKIHVTAFVPMFIESIDKVYEKHGMTSCVTEEQVLRVLDLFATLRDKGIANFFEIPSEIPLPLMEHLVKEGIIQENSARYYAKALRDIVDRAARGMATDRKIIRSFQSHHGSSEQDDLFVEIACYSAEFWTNLYESKSNRMLYTSRDDDDEEDEDLEEWLDKQNDIMVICWDALGGFIGQLIGGPAGAVLGLIIGSVAYVIFGT